MKDSIGLREFYLTINEDVCETAIASNPETQWLGLRGKNVLSRLLYNSRKPWFFVYFFIKKTAQQSTRQKIINNNKLKVKAVWEPTQKENNFYFKRILKRNSLIVIKSWRLIKSTHKYPIIQQS